VGFVLAAILDFLIVVFAALPFANYRAPVLIAEIVLIALYRQLVGRTPGQQIVGVHTTTHGRQFARALLGRASSSSPSKTCIHMITASA